MRSFVAAILIASSYAHICLISPKQRGEFSLSGPGDHTCFRRTADCGGIPAEKPQHSLVAGSVAEISVQQNLNHWRSDKHGFIDVAISYNAVGDAINAEWHVMDKIDDFPAFDMIAQTNFTFLVNVPNQASDHAVIRVRYVSFNELEIYPKNNTDAIFYNCADVKVVEAESSSEVSNPVDKSLKPGQFYDHVSCVSPSRWEAVGRSITPNGIINHHIYYDAVDQLVRWDRWGALTNATFDHVVLITNYTDLAHGPPEYVAFMTTNSCEIYGADAFYPWSYGNGMLFAGNFTKGKEVFQVWENPTNGMRWEADEHCLPYRHVEGSEGLVTVFTAKEVESFDSSIFLPPSFCPKTVQVTKSCRGM
jgi:hypothetical protein